MKLKFTAKLPMRERVKLLFTGYLHVDVYYKGQHKEKFATMHAVRRKDIVQ